VIATHGDDQLGGADFDQCLSKVLSDKLSLPQVLGKGFEQRGCTMPTPTSHSLSAAAAAVDSTTTAATASAHNGGGGRSSSSGVDGSSGSGDDSQDIDQGFDKKGGEGQVAEEVAVLPCSPSNLRVLAERLKRDLSSNPTASASCTAFNTSGSSSSSSSTDDHHVCTVGKVEVSREEFETGSHCSGLFARALTPVEDLLNEALMPKEEVTKEMGCVLHECVFFLFFFPVIFFFFFFLPC
jgi:molecular chaperone DnaK (HSP70)